MVAISEILCSVSKEPGKSCNKTATRMIFIGNEGYGICDDCFKWFKKTRQLILKKGEEEK